MRRARRCSPPGRSHQRCLGHRNDRPADALDAPTNSPIFGSGIIASGPPSLGTLADCIIALSAAERGLARHYRGAQRTDQGTGQGNFGRDEHPPAATLEPGVLVHWRSNDHFASRNACQAREV